MGFRPEGRFLTGPRCRRVPRWRPGCPRPGCPRPGCPRPGCLRPAAVGPRHSAPHSCRWRGLARPRATQLRRPRGRAPGSRGAGSRLAALPRKGGTTPRRGGTRPRCDLLPRPLRVAGPSSSSLTSSSGLHGSHTPDRRAACCPLDGRPGPCHGAPLLQVSARFPRAPGGHGAVTAGRRQS